ncbi:MAG: hypothetical protein A2W22_01855 [Candidatus Levybacteria bacterium RBG_16_35_11]|nr:MAG: hypothetical protein A2W22_01855 [Candidatus Levybacteria bacterium RBG_16_35_11]
MKNSILTSTGKLRKKFLPAIYFDSSVLIDYWRTEGMEMPETVDNVEENNSSHLSIIKEILKKEKTIKQMVKIRRKLLFEKVNITPVVSPLSLLELMEWHTEASFKQIASESLGTIFIQKMGKKELGNYLKEVLKKAEAEERSDERQNESTALERLMLETWLNSSFAMAHGLKGLLIVDMVNFNLSVNEVWREQSAYAYLQLGVADIMHILLAQHLRCEYIASFDEDFKRVKDMLEKIGISVLTSPEEILAKL